MSLVLEVDSGEEICLVQGIKNLIYCHFFFFKKSAFVLHGRRRKRNGVMAEIQSTFVIFMLCSTGLAQTQKTATHKDILTKIVVVNIISATMTQMSTLGKWWFLREKCKKCPKERFFSGIPSPQVISTPSVTHLLRSR